MPRIPERTQASRTERITTPVTEHEKRAAMVVAKAIGVPVSNLLRERSLADVVRLYEEMLEQVRGAA